MKTKNTSSAPKDKTPGDVRYLNYAIEFPDGACWTEYTHIVGGLEAWVKNTALYKMNKDAARALIKKGEYAWYVNHGRLGRVRHHMKISDTACERNWGIQKMIRNVVLEAND